MNQVYAIYAKESTNSPAVVNIFGTPGGRRSMKASRQIPRINKYMRKPRALKPLARYHVIARANRREMILLSREMKDLFLTVVKRSKTRYIFYISNFCIMGNHFHFILQPGDGESLSKIMQWILSVFAIHFNKSHEYSGHVWYDRFWSRILDNIRQFIAVFDYIVQTPVKAGIATNVFAYDYWVSVT